MNVPKYDIALISLAIVQDWFTSGVIYGWAALEVLLLDEGVYSYLCEGSDCIKQKTRLNLIYTVGTVCTALTSVLIGPIFDKFGPKIASITTCFLLITGCILFAFSNKDFDAFIPAFGLIGFGAPGQHVCIQHVANLLPNREGLVTSLFAGAWTLSSLVFIIFLKLYQITGVGYKYLFLGYAAISLLVLITSAIFWPSKPYPFRPDSENQPLLQENNQKGGLPYSLRKRDFRGQFISAEFLFVSFYFGFAFSLAGYYIGSVRDQLIQIGDTGSYLNIFYWIQTFGFISIPIVGWMIDQRGLIESFVITISLTLAFLIILFISYLPIQIGAFVILSFLNVVNGALYYSYTSLMFGLKYFGRIVGITAIIFALFGYIQNPFYSLSLHRFHGNFSYVNIFWTVLCVLSFSGPLLLYIRSRRINKEAQSIN